jgi:hypothetical protein
VFPATSAIIFLGTPHRGSDYADWGTIAINIAKAALLDTNGAIVKKLKVNSSDLDILRETFSVMMRGSRFKVYTFQESQELVRVKGLSGKVSSDINISPPWNIAQTLMIGGL